MWRASSLRLRSFQAGSVLWKIPGALSMPYQPIPNPSPLVVVAPIVECRLWSISECLGRRRISSMRMGLPEYANQRHMVQLLPRARQPDRRCMATLRAVEGAVP